MSFQDQDALPPESSSSLVGLPGELLSSALSYLPNSDLKSLRLTCKFLLAQARLRLDRVFLSANPRDVEVFRAIANHEIYRKAIIEIIWDDSRFAKSLGRDPDIHDPELDEDDLFFDHEEGCPKWFAHACEASVFDLKARKGSDADRPDHIIRAKQLAAMLPLKECWSYYQVLQQQQTEVLASGADSDALIFSLELLPSLKRITITPAAHGWLFNPLYETPTIRSFPYGFNYPIPRGWPISDGAQYRARSWEDDEDGGCEAERNKWRGFRIITRALAEQQHHVSEFITDVRQLDTGLNCHIFDQPCTEYNDLVTLLGQPNFSRIDLALLVGGQEHEGWPSFRHGFLRRALGKAIGLQHISLHTNVVTQLEEQEQARGTGVADDLFIPLLNIFPVDKWRHLRHFGLSGFLVKQDDVLSLLAALSGTLRSVELSFLEFLGGSGSYKDLLYNMRDILDWHERPVDQRPKVTIGVYDNCPLPGRALWVDREVNEFLYSNGINPFGLPDGRFSNYIPDGRGVERDLFDPVHERPHVDWRTLQQLGYLRKLS